MKLLSLIGLFFFLAALSDSGKGARVVFKNETGKDISYLEARIRGEEFIFKNLKKGKKTRTIKVKNTYRYCWAKAVIGKDTLLCQPIDYVGEKLYTSGKVTMKLYIAEYNGHRRLYIR